MLSHLIWSLVGLGGWAAGLLYEMVTNILQATFAEEGHARGESDVGGKSRVGEDEGPLSFVKSSLSLFSPSPSSSLLLLLLLTISCRYCTSIIATRTQASGAFFINFCNIVFQYRSTASILELAPSLSDSEPSTRTDKTEPTLSSTGDARKSAFVRNFRAFAWKFMDPRVVAWISSATVYCPRPPLPTRRR